MTPVARVLPAASLALARAGTVIATTWLMTSLTCHHD
jgi:hypothetical protein